MPAIKLEKLISVSSEDPSFKAENLLSNKKWRSSEVGESQVSVVFQLSKSSVIKSIDIGNNGAAFIEILVSRLANTGEFKTLLVASSFLRFQSFTSLKAYFRQDINGGFSFSRCLNMYCIRDMTYFYTDFRNPNFFY